MLTMLRKKAKGFTLIELLIVVAIIGILAAIAIPNLLQARARSNNSRAATDSKQIVTQATLYVNDNNTMPGATNAPQILWNKGAPGNTVYMATTYDPWGTAASTNYKYNQDSTAGLTGELQSYSIGNTRTGTMTIGTAGCASGAVGYSNYNGSCGI